MYEREKKKINEFLRFGLVWFGFGGGVCWDFFFPPFWRTHYIQTGKVESGEEGVFCCAVFRSVSVGKCVLSWDFGGKVVLGSHGCLLCFIFIQAEEKKL